MSGSRWQPRPSAVRGPDRNCDGRPTSAHDTPDQRVSSPITARIPAKPVLVGGLPSRNHPQQGAIGPACAPVSSELKGSVIMGPAMPRSASDSLGQDTGAKSRRSTPMRRVASPDVKDKSLFGPGVIFEHRCVSRRLVAVLTDQPRTAIGSQQ